MRPGVGWQVNTSMFLPGVRKSSSQLIYSGLLLALPRPCSPITHDSYLVTSLQPQVLLLLPKTEQNPNPDMVIAASTVTTTLADKCGTL